MAHFAKIGDDNTVEQVIVIGMIAGAFWFCIFWPLFFWE